MTQRAIETLVYSCTKERTNGWVPFFYVLLDEIFLLACRAFSWDPFWLIPGNEFKSALVNDQQNVIY